MTRAWELWPEPAVRFPGRAGWLALPTDRRVARSGVAAYGAGRPRAVAARAVAWSALAAVGPRAHGPAVQVACPVPAVLWAALVEQWRSALGPFDGLVPLLRRQSDRTGLAVLLHSGGRRVAFVKLRPGPAGVEPAVLAHAYAARGIWVPRLRATGSAGPWHWFATEPLPAGLHRAGTPDVLATAAAAGAVVAAALPRPAGAPAHWTAAHGDLTPWNVRTVGRVVAVTDWEDATYAPPHTDALGYVAAAAAARGRSRAALPAGLRPADVQEAARWWRQRLHDRDVAATDLDHHAHLTAVVDRWACARRPGGGRTRREATT